MRADRERGGHSGREISRISAVESFKSAEKSRKELRTKIRKVKEKIDAGSKEVEIKSGDHRGRYIIESLDSLTGVLDLRNIDTGHIFRDYGVKSPVIDWLGFLGEEV